MSLTPVLVLTLAAGVLRGVEHAARQSYTHDVVGGPAPVNGLAVLGVAMRAGWLLGSLGVGAVIARFGSGVAYFAVAAGFLAGAARARRRRGAGARARAGGRASTSLWRSVATSSRPCARIARCWC